MRRLFAAAMAAAALSGSFVAANADNPVTPIDGGTIAEQCYANGSQSLDDSGYKFCRSLQALEWGMGAACRTPLYAAPDAIAPPPAKPGSAPEYCGVLDGREVSEAKVAAYEQSWVHRALTLQRGLDVGAPFWEEQLPHTHNSFNASSYKIPTDGSLPSYYATLTNQDPNQAYSITDQLRMDIRAIEIDLHWVPSPYGSPATHGYWPTMCHGDAQDPTDSGFYAHVGCTDDRPMQDGLAEVARWLKANPHEVLLVYLENQLFNGGPVASDTQAHDVAASLIKSQLGSMVYQPPSGMKAGDCAPMPYDRSRADMLNAGKQVLLVGNCGPGAWNNWVFTRGPSWDESGNPTTYGAAACAKDQAAREHHTSFRRWYEESPWLEAMTDATQTLTAQATTQMVRCGANIIGFDQLQPFDGRLEAMVWSWATNEPAVGGNCALQGADGRFRAVDCGQRQRFACVDRSLDWHVTSAAGRWREGAAACSHEFPGSSFGVPPNGYRNAQLAAAHNGGAVWLNYVRAGGTWVPNGSGDGGRPGHRGPHGNHGKHLGHGSH
jgi:hypothetical protein